MLIGTFIALVFGKGEGWVGGGQDGMFLSRANTAG